MAGDTILTVIGNLTATPEIRFTDSGRSVANFTVASTPRFFNKATSEWEDGEALFLRCNAWGALGEHVADSLNRGDRVIVQGRFKQRSYQTREGEKRTAYELEVDEIGPSLKFANVTVTKAKKNQRPAAAAPASDDQWATAPEAELVGAGVGAGEPPF